MTHDAKSKYFNGVDIFQVVQNKKPVTELIGSFQPNSSSTSEVKNIKILEIFTIS